MPFRDVPPRQRFRLRLALGVVYALGVAAGIWTVIWTPPSLGDTAGHVVTYGWAALLGGNSLAALLGVVLDRYRVEWLACWFAGLGAAIYVGVMWYLTIFATPMARGAHSLMSTIALMFFVYRALELSAHAEKLREQHVIETEILR